MSESMANALIAAWSVGLAALIAVLWLIQPKARQ